MTEPLSDDESWTFEGCFFYLSEGENLYAVSIPQPEVEGDE